MEYFEAKDILFEYRKGKTFSRSLLEEARNTIRSKEGLGSVLETRR